MTRRSVVLALAAVRPRGRPPDRQHDLHPVQLRVPDEFVQVVEVIRGIERVDRVCRLGLCDSRPVDGRPNDSGVRLLRHVEHRRPVVAPAKARVVLEPDEHPWIGGCREREDDGCKSAGYGEANQANTHKLRLLGRRGTASLGGEQTSGRGTRKTPVLTQALRGRLPHSLDLGAPSLAGQASLARRCGRGCRPARALDPQGFTQRRDEPLDRKLAIAPLAALVLGDRTENRSRPGDDAPFLDGTEGRGGLDVQHRLDSSLGALSVLAARAARAREAQLDLVARQGHGAGDAKAGRDGLVFARPVP